MATEAELLKGAAPQGGNGDTAFMLPMPHSHPLEKKKDTIIFKNLLFTILCILNKRACPRVVGLAHPGEGLIY